MPPTPPQPVLGGDLLPCIAGSYVYQAYGLDDLLLYVGVADNLYRRLGAHCATSPWYHKVQRITWQQFADREDAERAERETIRRLRPKYNVVYNDEVLIARELGHSRRYSPEDWRRLGQAVREYRMATRRTQRSVATDAGLPWAKMRLIESAMAEDLCTRRELENLEYGLAWACGSVEAVLAGGVPDPLTADERRGRALAVYDYVAKAV